MSDAAALAITRLSLTRFRNHSAARLDPGRRSVVLYGPNGAGKTNLLEAVSLLSAGRGLRQANFADLVSLGSAEGEGWAVAAEVAGPDGDIRLGTGWPPPGAPAEGRAGQGRVVSVNGVAQKSSGSLGDYLRILWLTPAMDGIFMGSGGDRRRFLDRLVVAFDPGHAARVGAFERLMRERNRLLAEPRSDAGWLASLEARMAEEAIAIAAARLTAADSLNGYAGAAENARNASQFPWLVLTCTGEIESLVRTMPAVQAEDLYRKMLHDSRGGDRAAGRTLSGPHRSDLEVLHGPKDMPARLSSTGEQKALLTGIVLAHARAVTQAFGGHAPVLLLDEVAAHLDEARRAGLYAELRALGAQVWMTGTDAGLFAEAGPEAMRVNVKDGALEALE